MQEMPTLARSIFHRVLEKTTSGRGVLRHINGEPIRFPARWCRYYESTYEAPTFAFLRRTCRPGDVVVDIGAHLGIMTVTAARLVGKSGRVFAFEPTPLTRAVLRRVVSLNNCGDRVEVRGEAVAATSGTATFHDTGTAGSNANSLIETGRDAQGFTVPTVSVDEFVTQCGRTPNVLKIDAEGAELDVLRGAKSTLTTHRPHVWLALHPPALQRAAVALDDIWQLLQEYEMRVEVLLRDGDGWRAQPVTRDWFAAKTQLFDVQLTPQEFEAR